MRYLTPNGLVERTEYVRFLRASAERWRNAPVFGTDAQCATARAANEEQAKLVLAKADALDAEEVLK